MATLPFGKPPLSEENLVCWTYTVKYYLGVFHKQFFETTTMTETTVNELLTRCIKFRSELAINNPSLFQQLEVKDIKFQKILVPKFELALADIPQPETIKINLYLEERFDEHGPLSFLCCPSWTVWTLKQKIEKSFPHINCPSDCQSVINGHRIAKDYATLQSLGVTKPGSVLYVYISRDLDQTLDGSGENNDLDLVAPVFSTETIHNRNSQLSLESESNDFVHSYVENTQATPEYVESFQQAGSSKFALLTNGWVCSTCTFVNVPTRPGCEMCSASRPADYRIPENHVLSASERYRLEQEKYAEDLMHMREKRKEEKRQKNYFSHIEAINRSIVLSNEPVECLICLTTPDPGEAVTLQECLHIFCKDCLLGHILASSDARVKCPHRDDNFVCGSYICDREVKALLTDEQYQCYLQRSLSSAEQLSTSSAHCKTPNCIGWCEYDDGVNIFVCPVCEARNCLTCQAIHDPKDCKEYQDELKTKSAKDKNAKKTKETLDRMLKSKEAMLCPQCNIIIIRKGGCDWIKCTMCKTEICWVTRGFRWGPNGNGDLSGGCHCKENGKKCHPDCVNCH